MYPRQLLKAQRLEKEGALEQAVKVYESVFKLAPGNTAVTLKYFQLLERMESWAKLASGLEIIVNKAGNPAAALNQLGRIYISKLGHHEKAERTIEKLEQLAPGDPNILTLRYSLAASKQNFNEALSYALAAVKLAPLSIPAYNNLGAAFCELGMREQGALAFQVVLGLDPENVVALLNMGFVAAESGAVEEAIQFYEKALSNAQLIKGSDLDAIKFPLSFQYLRSGELEKGWEYYDSGFSSSLRSATKRSPGRKFKAPLWQGEPLNGRTVMVWREQGLGDELSFASCLPDIIAVADKVIIETDSRLVKIYQRSFPAATIRSNYWDVDSGYMTIAEDFDCHIPMASLMRHFRKEVKSFYPPKTYILTNEQDCREIRSVLTKSLPKGMNIGICWRSGNLNPTRNANYTNLADWAEILKLPGCNFVNLQYGESESEIIAGERALGIKIMRWSDLDLKDDLEGTFALMHELDLVITVATSVSSMAPIVGTETWQLLVSPYWFDFGQEEWPWAPQVKNFYAVDRVVGVATALDNVKSALISRLEQRK